MVSEKLQEKLREKRRKELLPRFLDELSHALDISSDKIEVLSLKESDKAIRDMRKDKNEIGRDTWYIWADSEREALGEFVNEVISVTPNSSVYLTRSLSDVIGLVRVDFHRILNRIFEFVSLDQEFISIRATDDSFSFQLDYITLRGRFESEIVYEMQLLGNMWIDVLNKIDAKPPRILKTS